MTTVIIVGGRPPQPEWRVWAFLIVVIVVLVGCLRVIEALRPVQVFYGRGW